MLKFQSLKKCIFKYVTFDIAIIIIIIANALSRNRILIFFIIFAIGFPIEILISYVIICF